MKYVVFPLEVWSSARRRTGPKISYRVVNYDAGLNERSYPKETVAWSDNEAVAQQIADTLNEGTTPGDEWHSAYANMRAERDRAQKQAEMARNNALELEKRWQGCLDHANRQTAEARRERDEARKSSEANGREALRARDKLRDINAIIHEDDPQ